MLSSGIGLQIGRERFNALITDEDLVIFRTEENVALLFLDATEATDGSGEFRRFRGHAAVSLPAHLSGYRGSNRYFSGTPASRSASSMRALWFLPRMVAETADRETLSS